MSIQQLRFIERDGKRILQYLYAPDQPANFGSAWFDVPLVMDLADPLPTIDPSMLSKEAESTFRAISDPKNAHLFSKEAAYDAFKDVPLPKEE